jgi:hypothetical protein
MSNILKTLVFVSFLGVPFSASAQERPPRVRAKEPTVVTVEGKQDQVSEDKKRAEAQKDENIFSRAIHGLGKGISTIGKGIVNLIGGDENVIPSEEERRRSAEERKKK